MKSQRAAAAILSTRSKDLMANVRPGSEQAAQEALTTLTQMVQKLGTCTGWAEGRTWVTDGLWLAIRCVGVCNGLCNGWAGVCRGRGRGAGPRGYRTGRAHSMLSIYHTIPRLIGTHTIPHVHSHRRRLSQLHDLTPLPNNRKASLLSGPLTRVPLRVCVTGPGVGLACPGPASDA